LHLQEEQEQLAEVEAEARAELRAAQEALREAQEAAAISADKVAQLSDALKEAKVRAVGGWCWAACVGMGPAAAQTRWHS
jgi:predicted lipoprotein